ncbi:hypothetical protein N7488_008561 [Penicillium malachiteum]|nr:hypothetical protein N7488_008561 [Penicillium malachiteum]
MSASATFTIDGVETTAVGTFGINAKGVSIRWHSTDFTSATCTGVPSPTSSGNETSSSSRSRLSSGAKAGI